MNDSCQRQSGRTTAQLESVLDFVVQHTEGAIYLVSTPKASGYTKALLHHIVFLRQQVWLIDRVEVRTAEAWKIRQGWRGEKRAVFWDHAVTGEMVKR